MKTYHQYLYGLEFQSSKNVPKTKKKDKFFIFLAIFWLVKEHKSWAWKHRKLSFFSVKEIPNTSPMDKSKLFVTNVFSHRPIFKVISN